MGPPGSDAIEKLFVDYFAAKGLPLDELRVFDEGDDLFLAMITNLPGGGLETGGREPKTADEAAKWGGSAGQPYDPNFFGGPGDTVSSLNLTFFEINAKAMAHALATYATSLDGFPARTPPEK